MLPYPSMPLVAAELDAQLIFCLVEPPLARRRQGPPGTVDVEGQHRERRAVGIGLPPPAAQRRALERGRDLLRASLGEHAAFEIERIAALGHTLRPAPPLAGGRAAARGGLPPALGLALAGDAFRH